MNDEHTYIVTYDISHKKRWRQIFKLMTGYGEWIQLSVFQCRLSKRRYAELEKQLREVIKDGEDHVLLIDVGVTKKADIMIASFGKVIHKIDKKPIVV